MIDTIACVVEPPVRLADSLFSNSVVYEQMDEQGKKRVRLWQNGDGSSYTPRITYWRGVDARDRGLLKIEFSVPKLCGLDPLANVTEADVSDALNRATEIVRHRFHPLIPNVWFWRVTRIDYAYNFDVGDQLPLYLSVLGRLQLRSYQRQVYGVSSVLWTSATRKVKFYSKRSEQGAAGGVLRLEMTNMGSAVHGMCAEWFGCARTVRELIQFGRALYALAYVFEQLGLHQAGSYGGEGIMDFRLRDAFGVRNVAVAKHAMDMISLHGPRAYQQEVMLISKWTYYAWRKRLLDAGFLLAARDGMRCVSQTLDALALPVNAVMNAKTLQRRQNLGDDGSAAAISSQKNSWNFLTARLGLSPAARESGYLMGAFA